jgi:hypothetical protein
MKVREVRYDLFDRNRKPFATYDGKPIMRADEEAAAEIARTRLATDSYYLSVFYRLRDPGAKLTAGETLKVEGVCEACESIKLTFDPAVGKDTWFVAFDSASQPIAIGFQAAGKGLIGYKIEGWQEAGGLKWPKVLRNLGMADEVMEFSNVAVGEPDDYTYMRSVNE